MRSRLPRLRWRRARRRFPRRHLLPLGAPSRNVSQGQVKLSLPFRSGLLGPPLGELSLGALEQLDLSTCRGLTSLPSLQGLVELQKLELYVCEALKALPPDVGTLPKLGHIDVRMCAALDDATVPAATASLKVERVPKSKEEAYTYENTHQED